MSDAHEISMFYHPVSNRKAVTYPTVIATPFPSLQPTEGNGNAVPVRVVPVHACEFEEFVNESALTLQRQVPYSTTDLFTNPPPKNPTVSKRPSSMFAFPVREALSLVDARVADIETRTGQTVFYAQGGSDHHSGLFCFQRFTAEERAEIAALSDSAKTRRLKKVESQIAALEAQRQALLSSK